MSTIAQSRDIADPGTIEAFAQVVQSLERLKLLLVLTVADIRGVGPGVWNGWKGQLLRSLYYETEPVLGGGHTRADRKHRVAAAQRDLAAALGHWPTDDVQRLIARHYPAYWLKVEPIRRVRHAELIRRAEPGKLAVDILTDAFRSVTELTIYVPDHPRLLATIAGACAAAGANIVDAQIFTTTDGYALDTISLSREFDQEDDEVRRADRVIETIRKALDGRLKVGQAVAERAARRPRSKAFAVAPEVLVNNAWSDQFTVVEVSGLDRPGLLYELTKALSDVNLDIASAHVATFGERAVDVFYVTDLTGQKVTHERRQREIRERLTAVFDEGR
jgi:[protein-PII] uridylyltransferase